MAFDTQNSLLNAKDEIIENQKIIIGQRKLVNSHQPSLDPDDVTSDDLNSHINVNKGADLIHTSHPVSISEKTSKNGVEECCEFIKAHVVNGVILNGFLLWANIQRKPNAENIWKAQAISSFDKEEITTAKTDLWCLRNESTIGKLTKRQGSGKIKFEIDDICTALKKLSDNDELPIFLGTSAMVARTPLFNTSRNNDNKVLTNRLKILEDAINSFMSSSTDTMSLPHETAPPDAGSLNDASKNETPGNLQVNHPGREGEPTFSLVVDDPGGWNTVVKRDRKKNPGHDITPKFNRGEKGRNWRQSILHGTASNTQPGGNGLSADVDLVAYGFAKHVTSIQLSKYLEEMDDCTLLTKYEGAHTFSFKITIKPQCFERAKDPSIWPYRVGLRLYKYFNQNNKKNASTDRRVTFANETRGILRH